MDKCKHCGKDLSTVEEIHSVEGLLYCSRICAIMYKKTLITTFAQSLAIDWYDSHAEIVTPEDIGIKK